MIEIIIFNNINSKDKIAFTRSWNLAKKKFSQYFPLEKKYQINIFNKFSDYCSAINENRPKWGVTKHKNGDIFLFNSIKWDVVETGHNPSDLLPSLIHEMFHVYCFQNKIKLPKWVEEGVATYLSQDFDGGQKDIDFLRLKQKYHKLPDLQVFIDDFSKHQDHSWSYLTAYSFIKYLVKQKGKNFLKQISSTNNHLSLESLNLIWNDFKGELDD